MDTLESRLRERFNRPVGAVDAAAGIAGAYRIRRRRAVWHAGIGAVAAGAAVAAVIAGTTLFATPAEPAAVPTVVDWTALNNIPFGPTPSNFKFVDDHTGYAEVRTCTLPGPVCTVELRRSDDSGRTWRKVALTGGATIEAGRSVMKVFDADHLLFTTLTTDDQPTNAAGWRTADGGRTWSPLVRRPIGTVAYPPAGTLFMPVAAAGDGPNREAALHPDGHLDIITSVPAGMSGGGRPTDVPVYTFADDDQRVWVSVDQAATWHKAVMPVDFDFAHETVSMLGGTGDPQYAYVAPSTIGGAGRVLASADHGLTWTAIAVPARTPVTVPIGDPQGRTYDTTSAALTADGGVLYNDGARTWRLAPGATTFTPADQRFPIISVEQVGPNVLATSADLRRTKPVVTHWLSGDGIHWTRVNW